MTKILLDGQYLITDPCYFLCDSDWSEFCDAIDRAENGIIKFAHSDAHGHIHMIYGMQTAYGDGVYGVFRQGTEDLVGTFGVDAGMFAFIPVELCDSVNLGPIVDVVGELTYRGGDAHINGKLMVKTRE